MVETLAVWSREREGVPFEAEAFNRIINFLNGYIAAPFRLVQSSGSFALIWDPTTDLFTFGASIRFNATLTLDNTIWLDGYKADHTTPVHLIRVNSSDIIELGATDQRLSFRASLTNNTNLSARNAANAANITLVKLNTSDEIELGETAAHLRIIASLVNNTSLKSWNAANGAEITLVKLTTSDIVEVGDGTTAVTTRVVAQTDVRARIGSTDIVTVTASLVTSTQPIASGATPATAGQFRLPNATNLSFRNAANTGNLTGLSSNGADFILMGDLTNVVGAYVVATAGVALQVGANFLVNATTTGVTLGRTGGATNVDGTVTTSGAEIKTGFISPTALAANTDNWNPTGLSTARIIRVDASAPVNLTGIVAQVNGFTLTLVNISANTVTLIHDLTSTAANRFRLPGTANVALTPFSSIELFYDGTTSRWMALA